MKAFACFCIIPKEQNIVVLHISFVLLLQNLHNKMTTPINTSENVAIIAENDAITDTTDSEGDVAARELLVSAMDKVKNDANIHDLLQVKTT